MAGYNPNTDEVAPSAMSHEEMLEHQMNLHQRIQQQMQMQREITSQFGSTRGSFSSSLGKVEPDLGDNVFDMLDDLILIPSGAMPPERTSLSHKQADLDDSTSSSGRDSLADILESLDLDEGDTLSDSNRSLENDSLKSSSVDESFDDIDFSDVDDDFDDDGSDLGVDDEDEEDEVVHDDTRSSGSSDNDSDGSGPITTFATNSDSETIVDSIDRSRKSSFSRKSSLSSMSMSQSGNCCTLVWEGGLLGMRLRMSHSRGLPVVSKLTGRSAIVGIHLVDVGDLLLQIGNVSTRDLEFMEMIDYLKNVTKPSKLVFRRLHSDPMAVRPVQPTITSSIGLQLAAKIAEVTNGDPDKASSTPLVKLEDKYEIKWMDGPLGISLIASKEVAYPLVTRITGKNRSPQVQDVQPGHYLVQIGSYNTADGNFNAAIKYLQKVSKPVALYFCPGNKKASTRPELMADEFEHVWEKKQPLSFTVRPDDVGRIIVADLGGAKSIKVKAKGSNNLSAQVDNGDYIVYINDDATSGITFHDALLKLRTAKRPLVIRFKKSPPPAPVLPKPTPALGKPTPALPKPAFVPPKSFTAAPVATPPAPMEKSKSQPAALTSLTRDGSQKTEVGKSSDLGQADVKPQTALPVSPPKKASSLGDEKKDASSRQNAVRRQQSADKPLTSVHHKEPANAAEKPRSRERPPAPRKPIEKAEEVSWASKQGHETPVRQSPRNSSERERTHSHGWSSLHSSSSADEDEYEVVWPEGTALGLTLRVHPTTRFPVVARVTGTSNFKNIEHVAPGDVLFAANNKSIVPQPKFKQTLENLSKLPKPAVLRFRRARAMVTSPHGSSEGSSEGSGSKGSSLRENEYELVWKESVSLGLVFSSDGDVPKVTKVDYDAGNPGLKKVEQGDALTWIGSREIRGASFHSSMAALRAVKRPVVLRFQKRT